VVAAGDSAGARPVQSLHEQDLRAALLRGWKYAESSQFSAR
jgi:hypothetical protein